MASLLRSGWMPLAVASCFVGCAPGRLRSGADASPVELDLLREVAHARGMSGACEGLRSRCEADNHQRACSVHSRFCRPSPTAAAICSRLAHLCQQHGNRRACALRADRCAGEGAIDGSLLPPGAGASADVAFGTTGDAGPASDDRVRLDAGAASPPDASPSADGLAPSPAIDSGSPVPVTPAPGLNPVIRASRSDGVAPLAVLFDATATSAAGIARPFHALRFSWHFGDPDSGRWRNGTSRNRAAGPIAAHVFERPGTYRVQVLVTDPSGGQATQTLSIRVDDPNQVFSGSNTVCLSQSSDFSGCPAGAERRSVGGQANAIQSVIATGRRVLVRRGQTFSGGLHVNVAGPGILAAFGDGEKPVLQTSGVGIRISDRTPRASDWRVSDFFVQGDGGATAAAVSGESHDILLLRIDGVDLLDGFTSSVDLVSYWVRDGSPQTVSDSLAIVDCQADNVGRMGGYIAATRLMFLGNQIDIQQNGGHVVRLPYVGGGVLAHNQLSPSTPGQHTLKLHAPRFDGSDYPILGGAFSEQIVIYDNQFIGTLAPWTVAISPQSAGHDERIRDVLFEQNTVEGGSGGDVPLVVNAVDVTVRDNQFNTNGGVCVSVFQRGVEPAPTRISVVDNLCQGGNDVVRFSTEVGVLEERNNTLR